MTNVFDAHSFDHYATAHINQMGWTASASSGAVSYAIGDFGRNGTQGLRLAREADSDTDAIAKALYAFSSVQTSTHGFAFTTDVLPPADSTRLIAQLADSGTSQLDFFLLPDGTLQVQCATVVLGTTTYTFAIGKFYYIELAVKVDNTTGTVDIFVDEGTFESFSILSLNDADTQATGNASANQFLLCHQASDVNDISHNDFDDFYHTDPSDDVYPTHIGNIYVFVRRPAANGFYQDLAAVGAPIQYLAVNERLEDEDTTYITGDTVGQKASFSPAGVPINYDILANILVHVSKEMTDGGREVAPLWRIADTNYLGTPKELSTTYLAYRQTYSVSPATGVKWITPELNASEIGEEVTA